MSKKVKITKKDIIAFLKQRVEYGKEFRLKDEESLRSGWSGIESGECCKKCKMTNPQNPLQVLVGCKNPFQMSEDHGEKLCQCHIPFRKVAEESIQSYLKDFLWYLEVRPDLLKNLAQKQND